MNPFGGLSFNTAVDASNPLIPIVNPVLQLLGIIVLVVVVWRVVNAKIKGQDATMGKEIVFGIISLLFVFKPTLVGPFVAWLLEKLG